MKLSTAEYRRAENDYRGYCATCDDITTDNVEPDAEGYTCEECGSPTVMGIKRFGLHGHWLILKLKSC